MLIFEKSESITLLENKNNDKINLIYQFFKHSNKNRNIEIKRCLHINVKNQFIDNIYLLNEKIYTSKELGITSDKINQFNINKRIEYKDIFQFVKDNKINGYIIFINADIFLNKTIDLIRYSDIHLKKKFIGLSRYDYSIFDEPKLFKRYDSQDTWILHSNFNIQENQYKAFDFNFGMPGCDNKILYLMKILGYSIINDPLLIKTYHYHESEVRNYNRKDLIQNPYYLCMPSNINVNDIENSGIDIKVVKNITDNFTKYNMNDNNILSNYIKRKLLLNEIFIIPRIAGIENNYAFYGYLSLTTFNKNIKSYFQNTIKTMKNNAGIKLSNIESIQLYSKMYLKAFENCEIYSNWEIWGNVYISNSHDFITNQFKKNNIWALTFDIFHYIYSNPWTLSLKNKKILIISSFVESIEKNIPNRKHIYGIDLFPECKFIFSKPPQTQGLNESEEFHIEFEKYTKKIDSIINDFDIALVSCGGYGNLVCNYIYEKGKSAIYVGGVLQMYFGILGGRWIKERPDIVKLYKNEYWSSPSENERPKNYKNIESSCYW
jgi:hypothetical protein